MKITSENLELLRITRGGNFIKIDSGSKLFYFESCKECGEPYLAQKNNKGYCSKKCSMLNNDKMCNVKGENNGFFGKHHTEETKKKISSSRKGKYCGYNNHNYKSSNWNKEKNPNWKGGIKKNEYTDDWTEELRKYIRHRDNNRCQNPLCEHKNFVQCVHHIDGDKLNCSPSNLITLCKICHQKIHVCKEKNEYKKMLQDIVIKLMDGDLTTKEI
jgi:hypothetical protein